LPLLLLIGAAFALPAEASFPGQNGRILLMREGKIFIMDLDGSSSTDFVGSTANGDNNPAWSPDTTRVAFDSLRGAGVPNIWLVNSSGLNARNIAEDRAGYVEGTDPTWAPSGDKLAFVNPANQIATVGYDGLGVKVLTEAGSNDQPSWSVEGNVIVFRSQRDSSEEIYTVGPDGATETRLTSNTQTDRYPTFSPDGQRIAWIGGSEIWVMNKDGSGQTQLTTGASATQGVAWSPDGTKIAFGALRNGNNDIYTVNATDGSGLTRLTQDDKVENLPDWNRRPTNGTSGADTLTGTDVVDVIVSGEGDDTVSTGGGDDVVVGGGGNDVVVGGFGNDLIYGDNADPTATGGVDTLTLGDGSDVAYGGEADDKIKGGKGKDNLRGDDGDDRIDGGPGPDVINGGRGKDTCFFDTKKDKLKNCERAKRAH
jgi:Ca2+-binding RTX toxin-like protein